MNNNTIELILGISIGSIFCKVSILARLTYNYVNRQTNYFYYFFLAFFLIGIPKLYGQKFEENDSLRNAQYIKLYEQAVTENNETLRLRYLDSIKKYAEQSSSPFLKLNAIICEIDQAAYQNDSTLIFKLYNRATLLINKNNIPYRDPLSLKLELQHSKNKLRFTNLPADSVLKDFHRVYEEAYAAKNYTIATEAIGRIALLYRNKKELGKAITHNQIEVEIALKTGDSIEIAASRITELDLSYQLLPRPITSDLIAPLIKKGLALDTYLQEKGLLHWHPFSQLYLAKFYIHDRSYDKSNAILLNISDTEDIRIVFSKYEHLSEIARATNNLEDYRKYISKFKFYAYKTQRPFVALNANNYLLDYAIKTNQKDSAKHYAKRLEFNLKQVDTAQYLDYIYTAYNTLSTYYTDFNLDEERKYKEYTNATSKQIINNQKKALTEILHFKDERNQLQVENQKLFDSLSFSQKNFFIFLTIILLLSVSVFIVLNRNKKYKELVTIIEEEKNMIAEKVARKNIVLNNKTTLYLDEIKYIKSDRNYVEFHVNGKNIIDRNKLSTVMKELPPNFIKVHRSYIINKNFIKSQTSTVITLDPNIEIPLSRSYKGKIN